MKSAIRLTCFSLVFLLATTMAFAQGTTGTLTGTAIHEGVGLPGVTVTITSPNLQGSRTTYTNESGAYNFGALPPGDYTVTFNMEGMQNVVKTTRVGPAQTARADANLALSAVAESITVTASAPAVLETTEVQTNIQSDLVDELPIGRTLLATTNLAPGVTTTGPRNATTISGGFAYDNLFLVNGVSVGENLRGQPHNLFIEDAIQETTVMTGAVSAEFGNFTGGVVSAITKSGGNDFSGSLRDSFTNADWTADSPIAANVTDEINEVYEGTLGGRIIRDRLWFFAAGRMEERTGTATLSRTDPAIVYDTLRDEDRLELKLTGQITPKHTLVGSWLDAPVEATNNCQLGCFDFNALDPLVENPNEFITGHYSGILTNNLMVEAQYSNKTFAFVGYGGEDPDRVRGTPIRDFTTNGAVWNAVYFSGITPEDRDSDSLAAKLTYYLSTSMGTHSLTGGVQTYHETRTANNSQSASDFVLYLNNFTPQRTGPNSALLTIGAEDGLGYWPVLQSSLGSDLNTNAFFINDKWDVNQHWSVNLGARYDANDSKDSAGNPIADDSRISPRLGATYDVRGDGAFRVNASYSHYVSRLAETVAGSGSVAGTPALFYYVYNGPQIGPLPMREALAAFFAWFDAKGGTSLSDPDILVLSRIPGATLEIEGSLESPFVKEFTVGLGHQFLGSGFVRADYVSRDWDDFYTTRRDLTTGTAISNPATGARTDKGFITNTNLYDRTYDAVIMQGGYRMLDNRLNLGLNYTWSELEGNIEGETGGSGPIADVSYTYPEVIGYAAGNPSGKLAGDQTHRVRAWAAYDLPTPIGNFNFSLLQNFESGTPYSAIGTILTSSANTGITYPSAYLAPPTTGTYYFSDRGAFSWDDQTSTDLGLNYSLPIWKVELFAQADVLNMFDEDAQVAGDTTVRTRQSALCLQADGSRCLAFNPFTTTPVEGVHWVKGPNFGKPTTATTFAQQGSFQLPRTYRFSVGLRF
jgi:outer membrane receptor protein involved in Fe transport